MSSPQEYKVKEEELRRTIASQHVEGLEKKFTDLEEKSKGWQTKADNFETALRRAETRIDILNKKLGTGPQTAFGVDVVYPFVTRNCYDTVEKENIMLKEEFRNISAIIATGLSGQDVVTPAQLTEDTSVSARNSVSNEEYEALVKSVEEKEKLTSEQLAMIRELEAEIERLSAEIARLTTEKEKANENKTKAELELTEAVKKSADYQKKCAGFFNQVVSLNSKQQETEEEISALKQTNENLRANAVEREAVVTTMRDALKTCDDQQDTA